MTAFEFNMQKNPFYCFVNGSINVMLFSCLCVFSSNISDMETDAHLDETTLDIPPDSNKTLESHSNFTFGMQFTEIFSLIFFFWEISSE